MPENSKWRMNLPVAAIVWGAIVLMAGLIGNWMGFGGRRFATALGVAALLFGLEWFLAAPGVREFVEKMLGGRGALLSPLVPLVAVLAYAFGVSGRPLLGIAGAAYAVLPALLLAGSAGKPPGMWEDYAAAAVLWVPVQFQWMYRLFPFPPPLTHTLSIVMALSTGVAAFVLVRRLPDAGYAVEWRSGFGWSFAFNYVVYAAIAIFLGIKIGFLTYAPSLHRGVPIPIAALGILFFTAWPEEFLFRGILQNLLARTLKNEWAGLAVASVIFGLSHLHHAPAPNWKYALMATIAGLFYGHAWMKTRSLVPGALVHAAVDISWHVLFR
jgi:membrane protease YdiL (CAAX protease family)